MNYELLRGKHLLLDTNVLINYMEHPLQMEEMRLKFDECGAIPILDEMVRFEYIRGADSPKKIEILKKFLMIVFRLSADDVEKPQFPIMQEMVSIATDIANLYSKLKNLKTPAVDILLAAQIKKYHPRLILVTSDHKDFPPFLFDRIGIETIDTGTDIINICFYSFNMEKYAAAWKAFQAS